MGGDQPHGYRDRTAAAGADRARAVDRARLSLGLLLVCRRPLALFVVHPETEPAIRRHQRHAHGDQAACRRRLRHSRHGSVHPPGALPGGAVPLHLARLSASHLVLGPQARARRRRRHGLRPARETTEQHERAHTASHRSPAQASGAGSDSAQGLSPMDPPDAYAPPNIEPVPAEALHPFLRKFRDEHVPFMQRTERLRGGDPFDSEGRIHQGIRRQAEAFFPFFRAGVHPSQPARRGDPVPAAARAPDCERRAWRRAAIPPRRPT